MSLKTFTVRWVDSPKSSKWSAEVLKAQAGKKFKSPVDKGGLPYLNRYPEVIINCLICQESSLCKCREQWPNIASEIVEVLND